MGAFVVTTEGRILAFGAPMSDEPLVHVPPVSEPSAADQWTARATAVLEATNVRDGCALVLGIDSGRLVEELVRQSDQHVKKRTGIFRGAGVMTRRVSSVATLGAIPLATTTIVIPSHSPTDERKMPVLFLIILCGATDGVPAPRSFGYPWDRGHP